MQVIELLIQKLEKLPLDAAYPLETLISLATQSGDPCRFLTRLVEAETASALTRAAVEKALEHKA